MNNLEYYVYQLIDPRDNKVFYVGKGKGSRVLAHEIDAEKNDNSDKLKRINDIKSSGQNVIKTIFSQHLTEEQAFDDEAKLINFYRNSFPGQLTNIQGGHHCKYIMSSEEIEDIMNKDYITSINDQILLIKSPNSYDYNDTYENNYLKFHGKWKINKYKLSKIKYIGIVVNDIIKFVYTDLKWTEVLSGPEIGRFIFDGNKVLDYPHLNKSIKGKINFGSGQPLRYINIK